MFKVIFKIKFSINLSIFNLFQFEVVIHHNHAVDAHKQLDHIVQPYVLNQQPHHHVNHVHLKLYQHFHQLHHQHHYNVNYNRKLFFNFNLVLLLNAILIRFCLFYSTTMPKLCTCYNSRSSMSNRLSTTNYATTMYSMRSTNITNFTANFNVIITRLMKNV
jgi:hypothetical protein